MDDITKKLQMLLELQVDLLCSRMQEGTASAQDIAEGRRLIEHFEITIKKIETNPEELLELDFDPETLAEELAKVQ
jgi:hypothetical protein